MMLDMAFGLKAEAEALKDAVRASIDKGIVTADLNDKKNNTTSEVGGWICNHILKPKPD
jgi:3-isopropylmalate dehydrogenase